jgi:hypothetical protein
MARIFQKSLAKFAKFAPFVLKTLAEKLRGYGLHNPARTRTSSGSERDKYCQNPAQNAPVRILDLKLLPLLIGTGEFRGDVVKCLGFIKKPDRSL